MCTNLSCGLLSRVLLAASFSLVALGAGAQQTTNAQPADSIEITHSQATGDTGSGQVQVSLTFKNNYAQPALVHLVLGGFDGLGLEDDQGKKYKIHTTEQLAGTESINKGFINIAFVQFGDKQYKWLTYVEQKIPAGQARELLIRIPKVNKSTHAFTRIISRRQVTINHALKADQVYTINNVAITWQQSPHTGK